MGGSQARKEGGKSRSSHSDVAIGIENMAFSSLLPKAMTQPHHIFPLHREQGYDSPQGIKETNSLSLKSYYL